MKIEKLFQILHEQGFTIDRSIREIYYKTEWVGIFGYAEGSVLDYGSDFIRLCDFQPSLFGMDFHQVHKTHIGCDDSWADTKLLETILNFKDAPRRYEEQCRREKIENIKKYFEDRESRGAK